MKIVYYLCNVKKKLNKFKIMKIENQSKNNKSIIEQNYNDFLKLSEEYINYYSTPSDCGSCVLTQCRGLVCSLYIVSNYRWQQVMRGNYQQEFDFVVKGETLFSIAYTHNFNPYVGDNSCNFVFDVLINNKKEFEFVKYYERQYPFPKKEGIEILIECYKNISDYIISDKIAMLISQVNK